MASVIIQHAIFRRSDPPQCPLLKPLEDNKVSGTL